ncbi:hypothetical protein E6O75_ATG02945 [Venturia nashicola]|uniref:Uncharacterized protein n=1 Tax=Venturia nashicola TaxID=86259 RepID=A0A4Z1P8N7_9PEZI|nr:hypothetical protein E6O75_ATG02945 [Venturia nashicola]
MPGYSWKKAKTLLTETEKDRLCCLILTCADQIKPSGAEFAVAAKEFDAAVGGFTKMYQTTIKKLKDNNAFAGGEDGEGDAAAADGNAEAATTATKPKPTPRKRKAKSPSGEADGEATTPKKKGRVTKKAKAEAEAAAQAAGGAANGGGEEDAGMGAAKEEEPFDA